MRVGEALSVPSFARTDVRSVALQKGRSSLSLLRGDLACWQRQEQGACPRASILERCWSNSGNLGSKYFSMKLEVSQDGVQVEDLSR